MKTPIEICLTCPLLFCDDRNPECGLRPARIVRVKKESADRSGYWREYYRRNREKKIAAASARQKTKPNTADRAEYFRNYYQRRKQHEKTRSVQTD